MNAQPEKNPNVNEKVATERKVVDTVDHRSSAGQPQQEKNVQVIREPHPAPQRPTSGGVLTGAAAAVTGTLQAAQNAISKN